MFNYLFYNIYSFSLVEIQNLWICNYFKSLTSRQKMSPPSPKLTSHCMWACLKIMPASAPLKRLMRFTAHAEKLSAYKSEKQPPCVKLCTCINLHGGAQTSQRSNNKQNTFFWMVYIYIYCYRIYLSIGKFKISSKWGQQSFDSGQNKYTLSVCVDTD